MFTRKIVTGAAGLLMIAGTSFGAVSAHASGGNACTVQGTVSITGGGGILLQTTTNDTYSFGTTAITCHGSDPVLNGAVFNIGSVGTANNETCAGASGSGNITGSGTDGNGSAVTLDTTTFDYTRTGTNVAITGGTIQVHGGATYSFNASLQFTPNNGECAGTLGTPTTSAGITGAAQVS